MNNKCMDNDRGTKCGCPLGYAKAFVITQAEGEDMFEPMEALAKGTIYPALFMPYNFWRFKGDEQ